MKSTLSTFAWSDLLSWYELHGRHDLPWRDYGSKGQITNDKGQLANPSNRGIRGGSYEPNNLSEILYRVWISEIFLQQTQVSRVIGYFERVLERFPTLESLAHTDYETFFPYYQGLGYYSRARNMLRTAEIVHREYSGIFPKELEKLKILPGVGEYTARAILAFGYGEPYLAWDTNLEKVFARYYHGSRLDKLSDEEKIWIEEEFRDFLSHCEVRSNPGKNKESLLSLDGHAPLAMTEQDTVRDINNALMDFAATVDLKNPANIDWENYPIKSGEFYHTRGKDEPIEVKKSMSFPIPDATIIVVLHKDHKVYYSDERGQMTNNNKAFTLHDSVIPADAGIQSTIKDSFSLLDCVTSTEGQEQYRPFVLAPALTRDTRACVQTYFRERYSLELSVRPVHKKWISEDGKPYVMVHAQVQTGKHSFREYTKKEALEVLTKLIL